MYQYFLTILIFLNPSLSYVLLAGREHENENIIERISNMMEEMSEQIVKMEINNHTNDEERKETDQN